jgi:hypothetical protein
MNTSAIKRPRIMYRNDPAPALLYGQSQRHYRIEEPQTPLPTGTSEFMDPKCISPFTDTCCVLIWEQSARGSRRMTH